VSTAIAESPANVIPIARGPLDEPGFTFTATGLVIDPNVTYEQWVRYGRKLQLADKGIQWALGDWVRHGETHFKDRAEQAVIFTGKKVKTLQNYATVAEAIPKSRRRDSDKVDFSTHADVAMLPEDEQEKILSKAEQNPADFSRQDARKEAKRAKRRLKLIPDELDLLHDPEVQRFLSEYVAALKKIDDVVPDCAMFLHGMIQSHIGQAQWQKDRTLEADYEAIIESFENADSQTDSDIYRWLVRSGYFLSDPDLDDRLATMSKHSKLEQEAVKKNIKLREKGAPLLPLHRLNCDCTAENKQLQCVPPGGKQDERRGDMGPDLYTLPGQATGEAATVSRARSNYDSGERE